MTSLPTGIIRTASLEIEGKRLREVGLRQAQAPD